MKQWWTQLHALNNIWLQSDEIVVDIDSFMHYILYMVSLKPDQTERMKGKTVEMEKFCIMNTFYTVL
jgi:hypothetical protein